MPDHRSNRKAAVTAAVDQLIAAAMASDEIVSAWDDLFAAAQHLDDILLDAGVPGPQRLSLISSAVVSNLHPESRRA